MNLIQILSTDAVALLIACGLLGLIVGSFLNVVILRLPKMMEQRWREEAHATLADEDGTVKAPDSAHKKQRLSLWSPPSTCPHCHARIRAWENIPVLSWLALRGRCAHCKARISVQYPLVELICGAASVVCAWHFGWSPQLAGALIFTWTLLALGATDLQTLLLPDSLTLPLLWAGLLFSLGHVYCSMTEAIIGAVVGYLILWLIYHIYRLATGKHGMGYGDFKLLAAIGAWLGVGTLPVVIVLASLVGATTGVLLIVIQDRSAAKPLSFGPYLAGAGWLAMMFGAPIAHFVTG